jgi:hypothetical protein
VQRTNDSSINPDAREQASPAESGLAQDELAAEAAVDLPDREAMTTIRGLWGMDVDNFAMPINSAEATNISTTDSYAIADADQVVILDQDSDESARR